MVVVVDTTDGDEDADEADELSELVLVDLTAEENGGGE